MVWNKLLPDGNKNIALGDDDIRANNDAAETAIDLEHDFTTSGGQTGRHHFVVDTNANVSALSSGVVEGSIAFANDIRTGERVLMIYDGAAWAAADVGVTNLPRVDEQSQFTVCQFSQFADVSGTGEITAATPDVMNLELDRSASRYYTMTNDTQIGAFVNDVSSYGTTVTLELTQPGSPVEVTFAPATFATAHGIAPLIGEGANEKTIIQFIKIQNGDWVVSTLPNLTAI